MGRKERVWYPGAVYHIMNRGIRRSDIFKDEGDYGSYLEILQIVKGRYPFFLYSYCLMTNHEISSVASSFARVPGTFAD